MEFMTQRKFSENAEAVSRNKNMSYIEAVLHICNEQNIDPYDIKNLISPSLKSKIEAEAVKLKLITNNRNTATIPV